MHPIFATIMLADSDAGCRHLLRNYLERRELRVREAADGRRLLAELQREIPNLVLLDLNLPELGGLELCRWIKRFGDVPIVVFTAIDEEAIKLRALEQFAEDYILKTVSYTEVVTRVCCVLRRTWLTCLSSDNIVRVDPSLSIDFLRREARTSKGVFRLTPLECRFLELLIRNAGQVLPADLIRERVWGDTMGSSASMWEYVHRIRHKIGDTGSNPRYILNEPGLGYRFCDLSNCD